MALVEGYWSLNANEMLQWKPNTKFFLGEKL